jgi:hypothetical protein
MPWPVAPRPFEHEAIGSWLGRVSTKYRISVSWLWASSVSKPFPSLGNAGWIMFPPLDAATIACLSVVGRVDAMRLQEMQTPAEWMETRCQMPYCFTCLTLNHADISASLWRKEWLHPEARCCSVHNREFDAIPAGVLRSAANFHGLMHAISIHRKKSDRWSYTPR